MAALWTDDQATTLDLRKRGLTAIPGLERLTKLEHAWLADNRLAALPSALADLPALTTVSLAGNPLAAIDDALAAKLRLASIDFSHTRLETLPPAVAGWPLLSARLMGMPASFAWEEVLGRLDPTRLTTLTLGENPGLAVLPPSLGRFQRLRLLHLNACGIRAIPEYFAEFRELETLSFFEDELDELPEAVMALPGLKSLVITKNPGTRRIKATLAKRVVRYNVS